MLGTSCSSNESVSNDSAVKENIIENSINVDNNTVETEEKSTEEISRDSDKESVSNTVEMKYRTEEEVDPEYLDEIDIVAGSKYVWTEDPEVYMIYNDDGTLTTRDRSYIPGEYDILTVNYIVEDGVVWEYSPQSATYQPSYIEGDMLKGRTRMYIKE